MVRKGKKNYKRLAQKYLQTGQEKLKFSLAHITLWGKITIFWIIVCFISLFLPWISSVGVIVSTQESSISSFSSVSSLVGYSGIFIFATLALMVFWLFSIHKKQKFYALSLIHISAQAVCFWGAIFIMVLCLHSFFVINGLQFFSGNIVYGSGLILCMTGAIIICGGAVQILKENKKNSKWSYVSEIDANEFQKHKREEKSNMKLPF